MASIGATVCPRCLRRHATNAVERLRQLVLEFQPEKHAVPKSRDVTDAELAVVQMLWDHGPATIRQLAEGIYEDADTQYATVKKLLERLEAKGCVTRDRSEMVHVFSAAIRRDELIDRRLRELAQSLCQGSVAPLLSHAAKHEGLTRKQRALLHELIDELEESSPAQAKRTS